MDPHHGVGYGRLLYGWNWAITRWADHIVVHGEAYRQRLIDAGRDPDRVTCTFLTHLFVGYHSERELKQEELAVAYEPMILFFGRQERYKGVDILLDAFERLKRLLAEEDSSQPLPRLVLAGPGDMYRKRFGDGKTEVEWRNHLIGDAEGITLFRRCAVLVLPYRDATQSALVAAAYFFRKPVIVTATGALAEYVVPEETGLVVCDQDIVESLSDAMLRVLQVTGYKEALGSAGRAWYDERRARETKQFEGLYLALIR
jgi:glycosyltransferase involved in cell wall biosynthesis